MIVRVHSRKGKQSPRDSAAKKWDSSDRGNAMSSSEYELPLSRESEPRPSTLTGSVYERLRSAVLSGTFKPGEKLRVEALRERFSTGSSPVREALNRLLSEGYVALEEQKGFRVSAVSRDELSELVVARCWVDGAAITESVRKFDAVWEENLILSLHRLSKVSRGEGRNTEWETRHKALHIALVSGCGSRWVVASSSQLFDAAERYRLLSASNVPERNEFEEHRAIVSACLEQDAAKAVELLKAHYGRTFDIVMDSLGSGTRKSSQSAPARTRSSRSG